MGLAAIVQLLWRRRLLVALGAAASIAVGVVVGGGPTSTSGIASARLLLDTPRSQLIHTAPSGADTLSWRAELLADLVAGRPLTDRIAKQIGIRPSELVVVHPPLTAPLIPSTLPARAAQVAGVTAERFILTVRFDELLPIISVEAEAPRRAAAVRLTEAATEALEDAGTPSPASPRIQGLVVERIGPVRSREIVESPKPLLGVAAALVLLGACCAGVALVPRLLSAWRSVGSPQPA